MKCPKCGKEIANDSQFCEFCGTKINLLSIEDELPKANFVPVEVKRKRNYNPFWGVCIALICIAIIVGGFSFIQKPIVYYCQSDESAQLEQYPNEQPLSELMQGVSSFATISNGLVELTDSNFEEFYALSYEVPIIIDFYADWCTPCINMKQIFIELAHEYGDKIVIGRYDTSMYSIISASYNIQTLPNTYIVYKGKVRKCMLGEYSKEELIKTINLVLLIS